MKPIKQSHTTRTLHAPSNWDAELHGECKGLPISDFDGVMYSYWHLSWRDRFRILFGWPVRLCVVGYTHPPVWIDTEK